LVLVVIALHKQRRTITNFFLANLAIADLCVGVFCVLPNLSTYLSPQWLLGRVREPQAHTFYTMSQMTASHVKIAAYVQFGITLFGIAKMQIAV